MKIIEKEVSINNENLIPENSLFFDIETTGFSRTAARIYLIGTLGKENGNFIFRQYMTERQSEEKEIIKAFLELIENYKYLITFNGESFDFSFVKARAERFAMKANFENFQSIDMLKKIKEKSFFLELENFKLKTLEKNIGIFREDLFNGAELIELYFAYENGDKNLENLLLLHNEEDILNMPNLYSYKTLLEEKNIISVKNFDFNIEKINLNKTKLYVSGKSNLDFAYLSDRLGNLIIENNQFEFTSLVNNGDYDHKRKCIYIEKRDLDLKCNYDILTPDSLYLLKLDKKQLNFNIKSYLEKVLDELL